MTRWHGWMPYPRRKARPKRRSFDPLWELFFKANFLDRKTILLQDDRYQALVGLVGSPLTRQEIEGRKRLEKVPDWNLWGGFAGLRICVMQLLPRNRFLSRSVKLSSDAFFPIFRRSWRNIGVIYIFISNVFDPFKFLCSPRFGIGKLERYGCHMLCFQSALPALSVLNYLE